MEEKFRSSVIYQIIDVTASTHLEVTKTSSG